MFEEASKQSQDLKNYIAPGPRPPVYKFLDPPLYMHLYESPIFTRQHIRAIPCLYEIDKRRKPV